MYIFNQKKDILINTNMISTFSIFLGEYGIREEDKPWILVADEYELGEFKTKKNAEEVLKEIANLLCFGKCSIYTVD